MPATFSKTNTCPFFEIHCGKKLDEILLLSNQTLIFFLVLEYSLFCGTTQEMSTDMQNNKQINEKSLYIQCTYMF